ncbi:DUF2155 domain-containing protein [Roseovarius sp. A21]|uniref:DUF2155 domain-containing protein n=2 Tax=Roseovarius bejariae TaxID=2576383 RepID=A0A844CMW3_9RHOB|nr:DUF2155 domain-containing protein [Roseovarius bejariae]MRU16691.1 DUF2155 domain-containing protein [Roseovarius bejariae]
MRLAFALTMLLCGSAAAQQAVDKGTGAVLRGLDKVGGHVVDMTLRNGESSSLGRLTVRLGECRYPEGDPAADAYAFLTVEEEGHEAPVFQGWMIASSPALNAMEHARYDVWVMRCKTD